MNAQLVSKVKKSVIGKKYSQLTFEEWTVLFKGSPSEIDTICVHNKITNDSGFVSGTMPNFPPNAEKPAPKLPEKVKTGK